MSPTSIKVNTTLKHDPLDDKQTDPATCSTTWNAATPVVDPNPVDVRQRLRHGDVRLGLETSLDDHLGNKRFRLLVELYREEYSELRRDQKKAFAQKIIDELASMHPPGRFVVPKKDGKLFVQAPVRMIVEKTLDALRKTNWRSYCRTRVLAELDDLQVKLSECHSVDPFVAESPTMCTKRCFSARLANKALAKASKQTDEEELMLSRNKKVKRGKIGTNPKHAPLAVDGGIAHQTAAGQHNPGKRSMEASIGCGKHVATKQAFCLQPAKEHKHFIKSAARKRKSSAKKRLKAIPELKVANAIVALRRGDVLLGRGSGVGHHPGNFRFRLLVKLYKERYNAASRDSKRVIAQRVVKELANMNPPGQFVEPYGNKYRCVTMAVAVEKACQALREKGWNPFSIKETKVELEALNFKLAEGVVTKGAWMKNQPPTDFLGSSIKKSAKQVPAKKRTLIKKSWLLLPSVPKQKIKEEKMPPAVVTQEVESDTNSMVSDFEAFETSQVDDKPPPKFERLERMIREAQHQELELHLATMPPKMFQAYMMERVSLSSDTCSFY